MNADMTLGTGLLVDQPGSEGGCDLPLAELDTRYRRWESASLVPLVAFTAILSWMWYGLFIDLQNWAFRNFDPGIFLLQSQHLCWALPALMLGLVAAVLPMHLLYSFLLGSRYAEYTHYSNLRLGGDAWRAWRWMSGIVALLSAAVVPLALDFYTCFSYDAIAIHRTPLASAKNYHYNDIEELRWVPAYKTQKSGTIGPLVHILFRDGYCWSGLNLQFDSDEAKQREIANFVSQRSGLPIVQRASGSN
ncbi:MAG TPA: hypothetical protein VHY20_03760 [Pirellulales bacterium]|nr:hypothetical protein [Pirellulales bacterium]